MDPAPSIGYALEACAQECCPPSADPCQQGYGARMTPSLFGWVRSLLSEPMASRQDQQVPGQDAPVSVSVAELASHPHEPDNSMPRDAHTMSDEELDRSLEQDRLREGQLEPTTRSLPRSRLLSRQQEEDAVEPDASGFPNLQLVSINGQVALGLPDGRLVDPRSSSIYRHDLFLIRVRGRAYHEAANLGAATTAGTRLELRREPDNEDDPNAIAVIAPTTGQRIGYVNELNAKRLANRIDAGEDLHAISLRGSPRGKDGDPVEILVTRAELLRHLGREQAPAVAASPDTDVREEYEQTDPHVLAEDRWKAGTPPVHGLAKQGERSQEVAEVRTGQELRVELAGRHWLVLNPNGTVLGRLRWRAADNGKVDARNGTTLRYPEKATLHVTRLRREGGAVVDFGGYVKARLRGREKAKPSGLAPVRQFAALDAIILSPTSTGSRLAFSGAASHPHQRPQRGHR